MEGVGIVMWQVGAFAREDMGQGHSGPSHVGDNVIDDQDVT